MSIPKGYKLVKVTSSGIQFGNAWYSHESITGYSADQLNQGNCCVTGSAYMKWLSEETPPQPIYDEAKERELFEAWSADHVYLGGCSMHTHSGEYDDIDVQYSWEAWEARAKSAEVDHE